MKTNSNLSLAFLKIRLAALMALILISCQGRSPALTVTATTSDDGYPAHLVTWTDASGNPRSATMVDQNSVSSGPYTGYMRRYTYLVSGVPRVCTGQYSYSTGGNLEFSGDGFVQNHGAAVNNGGADDSTGNGVGFPGSTSPMPTGTFSHLIITYSIPGYTVQDINGTNQTVPTTVQWFFADGRNDPIFALTQDASGTPGALGLDSRSPYGEIEYDGVTPASPGATITGNDVGGFSYGDQYKFTTTAANPERVTPVSPWNATTTNTIPYAMQWTQTSVADAELGHVATVPLSVSDAGSDSQTSPYYPDPTIQNPNNYSLNETLYFDPRNQSSTNNGQPNFQNGSTGGYLPPWNTMAFQIINASGDSSSDVGLITNPANFASLYESNDAAPNPPANPQPTTNKKVAWQTNFGRLGGWDVYGSYSDSAFNYSTHSSDINSTGSPAPVLQSYSGQGAGARASGEVMSYSTFVVLGLHSAGTVAGVVTQMQNITQATLNVTTGAKVTSGPAGIPTSGPVTAGNQNLTVTYNPPGYNPIYSTWEITAAGNAVNATLTPTTGKALVNPVFLIDNYTSSQLPNSISINGQSTAGTNYFATLDTANHRLWITANSPASSAMTLVVTPPTPPTPSLYFQNGTLLGILSLNSSYLPTAWQGVGAMNTGWQERAVADINGDGVPDIIFQNGTLLGALILNSSGAPTAWVGIGEMNAGWQLCGAAKITNDGNLDLIFQNGTLIGYLEVNTSGQPVSWNGIGQMGSGWQLRGAASIDGTGHPDLIFQNGTLLGALQVNTSGLPTAWNGIGAMNAGWTLSYAVDVTNSGQPDFIFQNGTLLGALTLNTSFQPTTWHGIGAMGSGWTLPDDF